MILHVCFVSRVFLNNIILCYAALAILMHRTAQHSVSVALIGATM